VRRHLRRHDVLGRNGRWRQQFRYHKRLLCVRRNRRVSPRRRRLAKHGIPERYVELRKWDAKRVAYRHGRPGAAGAISDDATAAAYRHGIPERYVELRKWDAKRVAYRHGRPGAAAGAITDAGAITADATAITADATAITADAIACE